MSNKISDIKIRFIVYTSIIAVFAGAFLYEPVMNKFYISQAESCLEKENYICAFNSFRKAFATGVNNSEYVSHYVDSLSKIKKIAFVQRELNNLLENYPDSSEIGEIEDIFAQLKEKNDYEYSNNYIVNTVQGTSIIHWNASKSPINVYINKSVGNVPDFYVEEVKKSFSDYSKITNNKLKFYYTNNPAEANIEILFVNDISSGKCAEGENCSKVLGLTENKTSGSVLQKSTVNLRTKDIDNSQFTPNQIHNIAKHEIGHALGIIGHSFTPDDVMYPVSNDAKWAKNTQTLLIKKKDFSSRDIETINLLYNIVPDITNVPYQVELYPDMYYPIAVLGTKKQIGIQKLDEATSYVNNVTNNFIGQMSLAESYFGNKNYAKAKEIFEGAINYANTDEERFTVYHNLSVIYYQENDCKTAINYADLANSYSNNSADNNSNDIKAYCYIELKEYDKALNILEKQILLEPGSGAISSALVGVYLKKYALFKAINEIKRIKKENPNALQEPGFQPYKFLMNFA